ncbi:MAG: hypothetical protein JWN02_17 [Acidobacteria bacterium]|nr:hypothetical protein [Acidobacteriota bacterium]
MRSRPFVLVAAVLLSALSSLGATAPKAKAGKSSPAPNLIAPDTLPHPFALFLAELSGEGQKRVTYKATALGTHFFFEETPGVTVYVYDGKSYRREAFLKGATLSGAVAKYRKAATK